ncbi:MAG: hypothetical protein RIQ89_540 [Bacteroidota bacterium]|jgi:uncharacterized protein YndB with AHSA1/START domain
MKIIKKISAFLLVLIAVIFVVSLFFDRKIETNKSIFINAPAATVFTQLNELKNWPNWMPWHRKDPNTKYTYEIPSSGLNASYRWESENKEVGKGTVKISEVVADKHLVTEVNFMENGVSYGIFDLVPEPSGTKVTWTFKSDMGYNPLGRLFGSYIKSMIAQDYEAGLKNLKSFVETSSATTPADTVSIQ